MAIFFLPALAIHSAAWSLAQLGEMVVESLRSPLCLLFYAILPILSLMVFWGNCLFLRDTRRIQEGQLEA